MKQTIVDKLSDYWFELTGNFDLDILVFLSFTKSADNHINF